MGNKVVGGAALVSRPRLTDPKTRALHLTVSPRSHWEKGKQGLGVGVKGICQASSIQLRPVRRQKGQQ